MRFQIGRFAIGSPGAPRYDDALADRLQAIIARRAPETTESDLMSGAGVQPGVVRKNSGKISDFISVWRRGRDSNTRCRFVFHAITDNPIWRELSNNIIQKGLAFIGDWSGTVYRSGRNVRFGILPRRPGGRGGASVVRRMAPR